MGSFAGRRTCIVIKPGVCVSFEIDQALPPGASTLYGRFPIAELTEGGTESVRPPPASDFLEFLAGGIRVIYLLEFPGPQMYNGLRILC